MLRHYWKRNRKISIFTQSLASVVEQISKAAFFFSSNRTHQSHSLRQLGRFFYWSNSVNDLRMIDGVSPIQNTLRNTPTSTFGALMAITLVGFPFNPTYCFCLSHRDSKERYAPPTDRGRETPMTGASLCNFNAMVQIRNVDGFPQGVNTPFSSHESVVVIKELHSTMNWWFWFVIASKDVCDNCLSSIYI